MERQFPASSRPTGLAALAYDYQTGGLSWAEFAEAVTQAVSLMNVTFDRINEASGGSIVAHASVQVDSTRRPDTAPYERGDDHAHR